MYCRPGREGAHEKGGMEGQIGWFRRNHLVPVPEVSSLVELNAMVERWDVEDDERRIRSRPRTIGECFAVERSQLRLLPDEPFETGRLFSLRVDRYAQVSVHTNRYPVPVGRGWPGPMRGARTFSSTGSNCGEPPALSCRDHDRQRLWPCSTARCSLVVNPARERPSPWSRGSAKTPPGGSFCRSPCLRALAACWWARHTVESTLRSHVIAPFASARD